MHDDIGRGCARSLEAFGQDFEVRQATGGEVGFDGERQLRLAGALMSKREQADHGAAGAAFAVLRQQRLEGRGISPPRKQLVAIDQVQQRHRLAAQRMNHVPIVDDMAMLAVRSGAAAPQGDEMRRALKAFEPVVMQANPQAVADEPGGNGVEHLAQRERAGRGDEGRDLLVIGALARRQGFERRAFEIDALAVAGVVATDDFIDETSPRGQIGEVARAAQQQSVGQPLLQMAVRTPAETEGFREIEPFSWARPALLRVGVMP